MCTKTDNSHTDLTNTGISVRLSSRYAHPQLCHVLFANRSSVVFITPISLNIPDSDRGPSQTLCLVSLVLPHHCSRSWDTAPFTTPSSRRSTQTPWTRPRRMAGTTSTAGCATARARCSAASSAPGCTTPSASNCLQSPRETGSVLSVRYYSPWGIDWPLNPAYERLWSHLSWVHVFVCEGG